jgi:hypothetical protein
MQNTKGINLQSVVEFVNDKVGRGLLGNETVLVLLHEVLLGSSQTSNVVDLRNSLVGSVGDNLSSNSGVKTGHLEVDTDIGVIDIDNLGSAQVGNVFVITNGVGRKGGQGQTSGKGSRRQELAAFRRQGSGTAHSTRRDKCSGGTEHVQKNKKSGEKVSASNQFETCIRRRPITQQVFVARLIKPPHGVTPDRKGPLAKDHWALELMCSGYHEDLSSRLRSRHRR